VPEEQRNRNFWKVVIGLLSAIAAILTGLGGILAVPEIRHIFSLDNPSTHNTTESGSPSSALSVEKLTEKYLGGLDSIYGSDPISMSMIVNKSGTLTGTMQSLGGPQPITGQVSVESHKVCY
jgi:hypothetical protein